MLPLTPRAYIFLTIFFNSLISSLICDLVYTTGLPSSDDRISMLSESLCWLTINQASLPYSSQPQTFAYFLLDFYIWYFSIFNISYYMQKSRAKFKNVKIIAHPYTHNFPIFKHPAGVEPAPPIWKTGVISVRPRMHIYILTPLYRQPPRRRLMLKNSHTDIVLHAAAFRAHIQQR